MRIRWKFLLVLLSISLIPMIGMRLNAQKAMKELGNDLASKSKNEMIKETKVALKRLVEDHARILKRERELLEMMLLTLSSEIEKRLATTHHENFPVKVPYFSEQQMLIGTQYQHDMYCVLKPPGRCLPLPVNLLSQGFFIDFKAGIKENASEAKNRLVSMLPWYRSLKTKYPELFLWQYVVLENGLRTIYPEPETLKGQLKQHNITIPDWYPPVKEKKRIIWSEPTLDNFTGNIVFFVSTPLHDSSGHFIGVTAIAVPLTVFLHENQHVRLLSEHVTSLLVKAETSSDYPVRIVAQESFHIRKHMQWLAPDIPKWLEISDKYQLFEIADDLKNHRSEVREIEYDNKSALMAYQSFDEYGTALLLIIPQTDILKNALLMEDYVHDRINQQIVFTGLILIFIVVLVIGLSFIMSRSFTVNISKLAEAVKHIAAGDFQKRVHLKSRDELGELGETFNEMIPALEERVQMKQALDIAAEIQQSLLPSYIPQIKGMDIAAKSIYCHETGGDFYDFINVRRGETFRTAVTVGDVTGHGLSAALLMATARAFLRSRLTQSGNLSQMISDVNRLLSEDTRETSQFVTLFCMEIDPVKKKLYWIRAGHDPALLYDPKNKNISQLTGQGPALGITSDFIFQETEGLSYIPGHIILIGTDGIWETRNPEGQMFGKERIKNIIGEVALKSAGQIMDTIISALENFRKDQAQDDDITLVVIKIEF